MCVDLCGLGNHSWQRKSTHTQKRNTRRWRSPVWRNVITVTFFFFSCWAQFSSNSCNCCLIIWHIHISKCIQLQPVWDAADWVREFIHYNKEQSAPLSFSDISLFMMLSMALRLSENSGKQCVALRYIESSTIRSCVVDHFEREGERERDKLQTKAIVSIICPSAMSGAHYERRWLRG